MMGKTTAELLRQMVPGARRTSVILLTRQVRVPSCPRRTHRVRSDGDSAPVIVPLVDGGVALGDERGGACACQSEPVRHCRCRPLTRGPQSSLDVRGRGLGAMASLADQLIGSVAVIVDGSVVPSRVRNGSPAGDLWRRGCPAVATFHPLPASNGSPGRRLPVRAEVASGAVEMCGVREKGTWDVMAQFGRSGSPDGEWSLAPSRAIHKEAHREDGPVALAARAARVRVAGSGGGGRARQGSAVVSDAATEAIMSVMSDCRRGCSSRRLGASPVGGRNLRIVLPTGG